MFQMTLGSGIAIAAGCVSIAAICCAGFLYLVFQMSWQWIRDEATKDRAERKRELPPMQPTNQHEWN